MDNIWIKMPYTEEAIFYPYTVRVYQGCDGKWAASIGTAKDLAYTGECTDKNEARQRAYEYLKEELTCALYSVKTQMEAEEKNQ
jgi:hypothetical protein